VTFFKNFLLWDWVRGRGGGWDIKKPVDSVVPPQEVKDKQLNCFAKLPPHKSIYLR
jgi:hypothetical protein